MGEHQDFSRYKYEQNSNRRVNCFRIFRKKKYQYILKVDDLNVISAPKSKFIFFDTAKKNENPYIKIISKTADHPIIIHLTEVTESSGNDGDDNMVIKHIMQNIKGSGTATFGTHTAKESLMLSCLPIYTKSADGVMVGIFISSTTYDGVNCTKDNTSNRIMIIDSEMSTAVIPYQKQVMSTMDFGEVCAYTPDIDPVLKRCFQNHRWCGLAVVDSVSKSNKDNYVLIRAIATDDSPEIITSISKSTEWGKLITQVIDPIIGKSINTQLTSNNQRFDIFINDNNGNPITLQCYVYKIISSSSQSYQKVICFKISTTSAESIIKRWMSVQE